ncbi:MAG: hypothetical protein UGF89_07680 [Acutalibacteraceae bacterium]|nr:hypothetical protein [Acutalibacteraceae bacterium]
MPKQYKQMKWFVYCCSANNKEIKEYNIFNHSGFYDDVVKKLKKCETKEEFAEELRRELFYYYGSKCEWEIIITDWPTHIDTNELNRLNAEREETNKKYNRDPYSLCVEPKVAKKVDVYSQVRNNWDVFVDYVWSFKRVRKKISEKTPK